MKVSRADPLSLCPRQNSVRLDPRLCVCTWFTHPVGGGPLCPDEGEPSPNPANDFAAHQPPAPTSGGTEHCRWKTAIFGPLYLA